MPDPTGGFTYLLTQGVLGVACLLLIWAWWNERKEVRACYAERIADLRAIQETMAANSSALLQQAASNEARTRAAEAVARAQELVAQSTQGQAEEISRLRDSIKEMLGSMSSLREGWAARRGP